jgi:hypothetical protein
MGNGARFSSTSWGLRNGCGDAAAKTTTQAFEAV